VVLSKTIFCDLDGTLVKHCGDATLIQDPNYELKILPGTIKILNDWNRNGYYIIITTGRKESAREATIKQLQRAGILYDQLIMGFGGGDRILINDKKSNSDRNTAYAINIDRNVGLEHENNI
jgi:hypothetical protein